MRFRFAAFSLGLMVPASALDAQGVVFGTRVFIREALVYKDLDDPKARDTVRLQWSRGKGEAKGVTHGATVQRTDTVMIGTARKVVVYPYVLTRDDLRDSTPDPVYRLTGLDCPRWRFARPWEVLTRCARATVYVDDKNPSRLNVRPYLQPGGIRYTVRRDSAAPPLDSTISGNALRKLDLYYELDDRRTIDFLYQAWSFGAMTVPIRVRPSYGLARGGEVTQAVSTKVGVGLYAGPALGRARYQYVKGAGNKVADAWRVTLAPFVNLSTADVDAKTSRSAGADSVLEKVTFATVSPGGALMLTVKGIDVGGFVGWEYGIKAPASRRWDYRGRAWFGLGLGYQILNKS